MSFTYPMGLLGLIGIPILIILYIIKSHYVEQTVASVYLWKLSEKFLKKKKRIRLFGGLLSLLLEILAVAAISLTIAGPVFTLPDAASDYCFVLDASGSMMAKNGEKSRFEVGKERISEIIDESKDGSSYSLIVAGDAVVEAYRQVTDRTVALELLDSLECGWSAAECADALSVAQNYYTADHSPLTYLVTDKAYKTENINLINVSLSPENYAFVNYSYHKSVDEITVTGQVISYDRDADLTVELAIDGEKAGETVVSATMLTPTEFTLTAKSESFSDLKLTIVNSDDLMDDNVGYLYSTGEAENNRALIVSDAPAYLEFLIKASGKASADVISTNKYSQDKESYATGYGLYIFDSFTDPDKLPDELPKNATIWFFNLKKSIAKTGFSYRESVEAAADEESTAGPETEGEAGSVQHYFEPTYSTSTSSFTKTMLKGILGQPPAVKKYSRYVPSRSFTTLLGEGSDSLIFVGNNENGDRQVVFSFDLHDSDYPLKPDFLILMNNLLNYSFPTVIEETLFTVGDELTVNVPSGCTNLTLTTPTGKTLYPDFSSAYSYNALEQAGSYKLAATVNGVEQEYSVFVQLPKEESYAPSEGDLSLNKMSDSTTSDGFYDKLILYFIILALAFVLDWGVYCYEQYQLR